MDTQIIEILGKNKLISEILKSGLEVATPERDRGIDLIAYTDISDKTNKFIAKPIQMKASLNQVFSLFSKYKKFNDMIIAYVWNADKNEKCITYALTYDEAFQICKKLGWTETTSWERGGYSTTKPSKRAIKLLEQYKMTPEKWKNKILKD